MSRNWRLQRRINRAACVKQLARHLSIDASHLRRMARPDMSIDSPDASGTRGDWDRIEDQLMFVAQKPGGAAVVIDARAWMLAVCERALDQAGTSYVSNDELAVRAGHMLREIGEMFEQMRPGFDAQQLIKEATEAMAVIDQLVRTVRTTTMQLELVARAA